MILFMYLKMLGQICNTRAQQCNLHLRRSGIRIVQVEFFYNFFFLFNLECHSMPPVKIPVNVHRERVCDPILQDFAAP